MFRKMLEQRFYPILPYRVKYTESEYDIQNKDLLYKTHKKHPNT